MLPRSRIFILVDPECRQKHLVIRLLSNVAQPVRHTSQKCSFDEVPQPKLRFQALENKITRLETALFQSENMQFNSSEPFTDIQRKKHLGTFPYPVPNYSNPNTFSNISHPNRQSKHDKQQASSQAFKELWGTSFSPVAEYSDSIRNSDAMSNNPMDPTGHDFLSTDVLDRIILETGPTRPIADPWAFAFSPSDNNDAEGVTTGPPSMDSDLFAALQIDTEQLLPDPLSQDRTATLRAYILDREELPKEIRDPLLHFFFSRMLSFGVMLHVERFWKSLENLAKEDQPHPAFLFSMYHCASQFSSDEAVRALADEFFRISKAKLDEGVAKWDTRILDMIRAATVLTLSSYLRANFLTGWVLGGVAMRLCALAHYQRISFPFSSHSHDHPKVNICNPDRRTWVHTNLRIPSPKDSVELGECIWSFWIAWGMDQRTSIATAYAPAMHWSEIETPFPLPLEQYADIDRVNNQPMTAVYSLFDDSQQTLVGDLNTACFFISLLFLIEASRLSDWFIQPSSRNEYLSHMCSLHSSHKTPTSTENSPQEPVDQRINPDSTGPIPPEIIQLQNAVTRFVKSLPLERMNPAQKVRGGVPSLKSELALRDHSSSGSPSASSEDDWGISVENVLLHTEILTTHALILQQRADYDPSARAQSVLSARSVVNIIHIIVDVDFSRFGFYILNCWRVVAHILLDEVKRCRSIGNSEEAMSLTIDVELIIIAMKRIGEVYRLGNIAASVLNS
ncbi:Transcription factor domain, fungi [Phaffia rhodozyma]|uniref:Transcription factor domain, fungi n=1 Tax=Phaffia rhodozyma TaxID=264483 RepID=A0A0F7SQB0_PHARH|nr:Transcription factor domain, fungi [Phaffia rhodozyma]